MQIKLNLGVLQASISRAASKLIKTSFLETLLFRAREERKVYRDICPCIPLAGAAFDQSGNWPVKAGLRL
jgi:hypothetical protein